MIGGMDEEMADTNERVMSELADVEAMPVLRDVIRRAAHFDLLVKALEWTLPYAQEHAVQGSQCCAAIEYSAAKDTCSRCYEHTGFGNLDLEDAEATLETAKEAIL